jgi:hypothetical protein
VREAAARFSLFAIGAVFARPYSFSSSTKASNLNIETGTSSCWLDEPKSSQDRRQRGKHCSRFRRNLRVDFVPAFALRFNPFQLTKRNSSRATIKQSQSQQADRLAVDTEIE